MVSHIRDIIINQLFPAIEREELIAIERHVQNGKKDILSLDKFDRTSIQRGDDQEQKQHEPVLSASRGPLLLTEANRLFALLRPAKDDDDSDADMASSTPRGTATDTTDEEDNSSSWCNHQTLGTRDGDKASLLLHPSDLFSLKQPDISPTALIPSAPLSLIVNMMTADKPVQSEHGNALRQRRVKPAPRSWIGHDQQHLDTEPQTRAELRLLAMTEVFTSVLVPGVVDPLRAELQSCQATVFALQHDLKAALSRVAALEQRQVVETERLARANIDRTIDTSSGSTAIVASGEARAQGSALPLPRFALQDTVGLGDDLQDRSSVRQVTWLLQTETADEARSDGRDQRWWGVRVALAMNDPAVANRVYFQQLGTYPPSPAHIALHDDPDFKRAVDGLVDLYGKLFVGVRWGVQLFTRIIHQHLLPAIASAASARLDHYMASTTAQQQQQQLAGGDGDAVREQTYVAPLVARLDEIRQLQQKATDEAGVLRKEIDAVRQLNALSEAMSSADRERMHYMQSQLSELRSALLSHR